MSLGKTEFTAFFESFFYVLAFDDPTNNENRFLMDFANQFMLQYYPSVQAAYDAITRISYFDMISILRRFNEVEKEVVKITWGKLLKCNGKMPPDSHINSMFTVAEDAGIDMSDFTKYL